MYKYWYEIFNYFPVDGGWSSWSLGPCSKTYGGGVQKRTRVCNNPKPSCGGKPCNGSNTDYVQCNDFCSPGKMYIIINVFN